MRMMAVSLAVVIAEFCAQSAHGQIRTFPYEAVVVKDNALVRSGGSEDYYPTQRLKRDDRVTVHRHDPGGWLAIEPPTGSFSLIRSHYVDRTGPEVGIVREENSIAFVGSEFGDECSVWQRRLSQGTRVTILGEEELDTLSGPRLMYRIVPPARERRWISGDSVVPVDETTRQQHDRDPFTAPSLSRPDPPRSDASAPQPILSSRLQRIRRIRAEQRKLAEIDQQFRDMLRGNPAGWDLQSVELEYSQLRSSATWRPLAAQIDLRFPAIERYRRRKAEYEDFRRLTSETERRDAELIASQFGGGSASAVDPDTVPVPLDVAAADPRHSVLDMPGAAITGRGPRNLSEPPLRTSDSQGLAGSPEGSSPGTIQPGSRYVGAGIVQKMPEGGYVLTSSSGKRLARLEGNASVVLEEFIGKSVGLHGKRWYRDDIGSDFIEVTGLELVQIRR